MVSPWSRYLVLSHLFSKQDAENFRNQNQLFSFSPHIVMCWLKLYCLAKNSPCSKQKKLKADLIYCKLKLFDAH